MVKLPAIINATNMLVCGEDLGMVPECVPGVMDELGILNLEIQRMPKGTSNEFGHPAHAKYLGVVSPSCHDMSTIRGWWEEDPERTQRYYNDIMGHFGGAPQYCETWVSREMIIQHLHSPAMWAIFPIQDLVAMDEQLRYKTPQAERINEPSNPKHYWRYRFHLYMEDLLKAQDFNKMLSELVMLSGREGTV
jgi:4-alpha-glucanotransferase